MSRIDLSTETDQSGMRRAYVNLKATANEGKLLDRHGESAFDLA